MFGRNSNQNNNGVNVNTTFKTFFSDLSSLTIGAWNGQISIRLIPCTGTDANGLRQYDQNRRANTALYPEKADALRKGIVDVIIPALKNISDGVDVSLPVSVSVSMGNNEKKNVLSVEIDNDQNQKPRVYLRLYQMIREDNSTDPQNIYSYVFGENSYVTNYDYRTGKFAGEKDVESEWDVFYDILCRAVDILPISAHGVRYVNQLSSRFSNTNSGNTGNNFPAPTPAYEAPVSSFMGTEDMGLPFN